MDIIFQGQHTVEDTAENLIQVLRLFRDRYHIAQFREMHVTLTLVDEQGEDVELVDSQTDQVYRVFEVVENGHELTTGRSPRSMLKLVIDNTR